MAKVELVAAYVLHTRAYRETSLLVELWTLSHGRIHAVAKGAKRARSPFKHVLQAFNPLLVSWVGRSDLVTLTQAETRDIVLPLPASRLMCGFYLNELVLRLLASHDPHATLFFYYESTLDALRHAAAVAPALRVFEKHLLRELGYGVDWSRDVAGAPIEASQVYRLDQGGLSLLSLAEHDVFNPSVISGQTILAIHKERWPDLATLKAAKFVLRSLISAQVGSLKTSP